AYYWLGRTAHLLADVSVPAHTLLDRHGITCDGDDDAFEDFTAEADDSGIGNYTHVTSGDARLGTLLDLPAGYSTPAGYDPELTKLFYNMSTFSRQFDSDDVIGSS